MQKTNILQRVWFRALLVCVLGVFASVGAVGAATVIGNDNITLDTAPASMYYSDQGMYGDAAGWQPAGGSNGLFFENGNSESGGFFSGDLTAIWSPGDTVGILAVYDEDDLGSGDYPVFLVTYDGGIWVGDDNQDGSVTTNYVNDPPLNGQGFFEDSVEVDGSVYIGPAGSIEFVNDGVGDLFVSDSFDVNGTAWFAGTVNAHGDVDLGDGDDRIDLGDGTGDTVYIGGDGPGAGSDTLEVWSEFETFTTTRLGDDSGDIIYLGGGSNDFVNINGTLDVLGTAEFSNSATFEANVLAELGAAGPDLFFIDTGLGVVEMGDLDVALGNGAYIEVDMLGDWIGIGGDNGSGGVLIQIGDDPNDMVGLAMGTTGSGGVDIGPDAGLGPAIQTHYSIPGVVATTGPIPGSCFDTPVGGVGSVGSSTTVLATPEDPGLLGPTDVTWYGWSDGTSVYVRVCDFNTMVGPGFPVLFNVDVWMH